MTKQERLLNALQHGQELTAAQIISRFGFVSPNAVTSAVRNLRTEGYSVYANRNANGVVKYRIGTPTRAIIAAGYSVLGA